MGTSSSRHGDPSGNELFNQLYGHEPIPSDSPFWNKLLSFSLSPPTTWLVYNTAEFVMHGCNFFVFNIVEMANLWFGDELVGIAFNCVHESFFSAVLDVLMVCLSFQFRASSSRCQGSALL